MAGMYDASLDAFARNEWNYQGIYFTRRLPWAAWNHEVNMPSWGGYSLSAYLNNGKSMPIPVRELTHWQQELFNPYRGLRSYAVLDSASPLSGSVMYSKAERKMARANGLVAPQMSERTLEGGSAESVGTNAADALRTNFAETAFFQSALRTNAAGEVSIAFTLPESMTRWNFSALAHDGEMNHGRLDTTLVARKEFMVEVALPRFVRPGDHTLLPVKVSNLSDHPVTAKLTLTLEDALHEGRTLLNHAKDIKLTASEVKTYYVPYTVTEEADMLVCRAQAEGSGYSDGEEHYLPVLSNRVEVVRTLPFSMTDRGEYTYRIDTLFQGKDALHRSLGIELSAHPLWNVVTALPALAGSSQSLSATEWATRYYALTLGKKLGELHPELRRLAADRPQELSALAKLQAEGLTDGTPWLQDGETARARGESLRQLFDAELSAAYLHT
ncbi:MAG: alpha-2-macroglobulin family protein, partial [Rothia sp. (in: high G+C Gram-positive bacteria)]|uniref:alpha-2-macroglobulin family protein n=1 Tax=Rothia sp. (in: high G+C Gram-positive bacteria) TaxID=1885016 RepID=UPI0026DF0C0B